MVLAEGAAEIAPRRGDGIGARTGEDVEEGLLLDGVAMCGNDRPGDEAGEDPRPVFPDAADAPRPGIDPAAVGAERAAYRLFSFLFVEKRFTGHFYRFRDTWAEHSIA